MKKKKLLIICDSHGTNWGCKGYANLIEESLSSNWEATTIELPGLSIKKAIPAVTGLQDRYDSILIGLGNPDIHPRVPRKIISTLRALGIKKARDSYFSIPPIFCTSYILRLPLFLLRLIFIRIKPDFYSTQSELKSSFTKIINDLSIRSNKIFIIPTFKADHRLYGRSHNLRAIEFNSFLYKNFPASTINLEDITRTRYEDHYNKDLFHFKQEYQDRLSAAITNLIEKSPPPIEDDVHNH